MTDRSITVRIERPPRPTIWLDTNILIEIARAKLGKKADTRAVAIGDKVAGLVRERRVICLDAEQRSEMRDSRAVHKALDELALGARMRPLYEVQRRQLRLGLESQLGAVESITLPTTTFFERDPAAEVEDALQRGWMLSVHVPTHPDLRTARATTKTSLHRFLEKLRLEKRAKRVSFEEQLEQEFGGRFAALQTSVQEMLAALAGAQIADPLESDRETAIERGIVAVRALSDLRSTGATTEQTREFLSASSQYRRVLPCEDVFCRLFARLVTQSEGVGDSDSNDVDHMALVVPIVSLVVTDVVLASAVRRLRLDRKYGCKVFSLRDTDQLLAELKAL